MLRLARAARPVAIPHTRRSDRDSRLAKRRRPVETTPALRSLADCAQWPPRIGARLQCICNVLNLPENRRVCESFVVLSFDSPSLTAFVWAQFITLALPSSLDPPPSPLLLIPTRLGWQAGILKDRPANRSSKGPFDDLKDVPVPEFVSRSCFHSIALPAHCPIVFYRAAYFLTDAHAYTCRIFSQ